MIDYLFSLKYSTGADGSADISVKVPGTFNGFSEGSNGRYLKKTLIWTKNHVHGDRLSGVSVKDLDGVIPLAFRAAFPSYPILMSFSDPDMTYQNEVYEILIPPEAALNIGPIDPKSPRFIPAGLYICATFTAGAISLGRELYLNVQWAKA